MFPTGKYLKVWFLGPYTFDNFEFGIGQSLMEISFWLVGETLGGWGTEIRVTYSSLIQLRCSKGLRSGKLPAVTVIVLPSRPRAKSTGTQAPLKLQLELFFKFFFQLLCFFFKSWNNYAFVGFEPHNPRCTWWCSCSFTHLTRNWTTAWFTNRFFIYLHGHTESLFLSDAAGAATKMVNWV